MGSPDDSNIRIISDEQTRALAEAAASCDSVEDGAPPVHALAARIGVILGVDFVVFCRRDDAWSELADRVAHPLGASLVHVLDEQQPARTVTVRTFNSEDWTFVRGSDRAPIIALAIAGDWTLSATALLSLAHAIEATLGGTDDEAATVACARLHYRMMHQLARVDGLARVSETVLRHAVRAVNARVGAMAVISGGGNRASIVATVGYPLLLVEHLQIELGDGVIGSVLQSRRPLLEIGTGVTRAHRPRYRTHSFIAVPIVASGEALGAICVTDKKHDRAFAKRDVAMVRMFAAGAALALGRERARDSADAHAQAAAVDPVTGIFNRRYFQVRLDEELQRARRNQVPVALLLIDVDDFKHVNDSFGHLAGDRTLRDIGEILRSCVRIFDVCARFGGEEFAVIMPGSNIENAFGVAERIRQRVEAYQAPGGALTLRITVSIGLAVSSSATTVSELIELSDRGLYAAKRSGKNRIGSYPSTSAALAGEDLTHENPASLGTDQTSEDR